MTKKNLFEKKLFNGFWGLAAAALSFGLALVCAATALVSCKNDSEDDTPSGDSLQVILTEWAGSGFPADKHDATITLDDDTDSSGVVVSVYYMGAWMMANSLSGPTVTWYQNGTDITSSADYDYHWLTVRRESSSKTGGVIVKNGDKIKATVTFDGKTGSAETTIAIKSSSGDDGSDDSGSGEVPAALQGTWNKSSGMQLVFTATQAQITTEASFGGTYAVTVNGNTITFTNTKDESTGTIEYSISSETLTLSNGSGNLTTSVPIANAMNGTYTKE